MTNEETNKKIILNYIESLDNRNYSEAEKYLDDNVKVIGPAGESFFNPKDFLDMLSKQKGKYDIKKLFVDGSEVCLLYNFVTTSVTAFMSSWYKIKNDKIFFIQTIFDSKLFSINQI